MAMNVVQFQVPNQVSYDITLLFDIPAGGLPKTDYTVYFVVYSGYVTSKTIISGD